MTKIKKIVAAAIAAATVGTVGMTAFAASDPKEFWLNVEAYDDSEFSDYAKKTDSYSVPAHATAYNGASTSKPVTVDVCDRTEVEYYNTLTSSASIKENYKTVYMAYSRTGYPTKYDEFYLHGTSRYDVELYGWWAP